MLDIQWIRENKEAFDKIMKARGADNANAKHLLALDKARKDAISSAQKLQTENNEIAKKIGEAKASQNKTLAEQLQKKARLQKQKLITAEEKTSEAEERFSYALSLLPNIVLPDVPLEASKTQNEKTYSETHNEPIHNKTQNETIHNKTHNKKTHNKIHNEKTHNKTQTHNETNNQAFNNETNNQAFNQEIYQWGNKRTKSTKGKKQPKSHEDIGIALGQMDFEVAALMSGTRFVLLKDDLAQLSRALKNFMLDIHTQEFSYQEINTPLLVREQAIFNTGQLPKFGDDLFKTTDNRFLIPTAEVPLTNLVADKIIDAHHLPLRFTAYTACFRAEAGAAGRDTKGMLRQHQFEKVELVSIIGDEKEGLEELERMTKCAQAILERLELPYQLVLLSANDMGFAACKTYDLEVWLPSQNQYREISSCSYCGDFQARRMKARWRHKGEKKTRFLHTLNGSGLAIGRTLIALLENHLQADGRVYIPKPLQKYMNGKTHIAKKDIARL